MAALALALASPLRCCRPYGFGNDDHTKLLAALAEAGADVDGLRVWGPSDGWAWRAVDASQVVRYRSRHSLRACLNGPLRVDAGGEATLGARSPAGPGES